MSFKAATITAYSLSGAADLHLHSSFSDGSASVTELWQQVRAQGLRYFALTDHDTLAGLSTLCALSKPHNISNSSELSKPSVSSTSSEPKPDEPHFVPGCELSLDFAGQEVHLLAYFPNLDCAQALAEFLAGERRARQLRNELLLRTMWEHGFKLELSDLAAYTQPGREELFGRVHIALWLVDRGWVSSVDEAFSKYLASGRPLYVRRNRAPLAAGIAAIQQAKGLAFLAHPQQYAWLRNAAACPSLRCSLAWHKLEAAQKLGLDGVEAFHGQASYLEQNQLATIAQTLGLGLSAGSDWHGQNKDSRLYSGGQDFAARLRQLPPL